MSAARKDLPPPAGADTAYDAMRRRYQSTDKPRTERDRTRASSAMDRRSWYMPKDSADALAELVDDLHFATRTPKHEILQAIVREVLARRAAIEKRLKGR